MILNESERASLLVPAERQSRVVHQLAGGKFGRLPAAEHGGNDVGREQRETEQPRCVEGDEAVRLGNLLQGETAVMGAVDRGFRERESQDEWRAGSGCGCSEPSSKTSRISLPARLRRTGMDRTIGSGSDSLPLDRSSS